MDKQKRITPKSMITHKWTIIIIAIILNSTSVFAININDTLIFEYMKNRWILDSISIVNEQNKIENEAAANGSYFSGATLRKLNEVTVKYTQCFIDSSTNYAKNTVTETNTKERLLNKLEGYNILSLKLVKSFTNVVDSASIKQINTMYSLAKVNVQSIQTSIIKIREHVILNSNVAEEKRYDALGRNVRRNNIQYGFQIVNKKKMIIVKKK